MRRNQRRRAAGTDLSADPKRRRGSIYIMTLGVAVTATVIGLASVTISRVNTRALTRSNDWAEARLLAFTAVEHALTRINRSSNWRTEFDGNVTNVTFGRGAFRWRVVDESDGDLTDDPADPAVLFATGVVNDANYSVSLLLKMKTGPLKALRTCITANGELVLWGSQTSLTPIGSYIHTNAAFSNWGTLDGNLDADSISKIGTVTGTVTVPAPPLAMPDPNVLDMYKSIATTIPYSPTLENMVISPQTAPGGATNPDGVYYMNTNGQDLRIRNVRIHGTLIIECVDKKVMIEDSVFMENYRSDYPVLIIIGRELQLMYKSGSKTLSESEHNTNFNPPGSPYAGQSDSDMTDEYPNEIRGLVHVPSNVELKETARVRGVIIAEGNVRCEGTNQVIYDPSLYDNPPIGYTSPYSKIGPDAWKRVVE